MLRERWIELRNRLLASPAFQRRAARFPLTRPIARKRAARLFDLVAGFVYAQVLAACVKLGLFEMLGPGPLALDSVAARTGLPPESAERLLKAAAALGLTERLDGDRYALGPHGAAMLGNPGIAAMVAHHDRLYADLADPVALLKEGGGRGSLADYWPYEGGDASAYSALMTASQPLVAAQILDAHNFGRHRRLLDIGGGEGAFLRAAAERWPKLERVLFALPAVGARVSGVETVAGSFVDDSLPRGADVVSLVRILHDHDDATVRALLAKVHAVLPAGGALVIAEPMAGTRGAEAMGDAYFGLYLFAMGKGRPRTAADYGAMLEEAGFNWRERPTALPLTVRVIVARKD